MRGVSFCLNLCVHVRSGGSRDFALGWQRGGNRSRGGAEVRGAIYGKKIVLTHIVI
jgi:hypothetical protein